MLARRIFARRGVFPNAAAATQIPGAFRLRDLRHLCAL
jgi:hypothetical protein